MLLDVAAIVTTSSTLGTVAEAFSALENAPYASVAAATWTVEQTAWAQALDVTSNADPVRSAAAGPSSATAGTSSGPDASAPDPIVAQNAAVAVPAAKLPSLRGVELLDQLALLTPTQLSTFLDKNSAAVSSIEKASPTVVATTWANWTPEQQSRMVKNASSVIGSVEGFPYEVRNVANRAYLTQAERDIKSRLEAGVGRAAHDELIQRLHMLGQVRDALKVGPSGNPRSLVSLDPSGEGRAVIAIGDPSTADYVDYLIPGMFSDVDTQIAAFTDSSDNIATQQEAWLRRLNPGTPSSQLPTVATMAWIGYHTPNIVNVASMELAREGQEALTQSIAGLQAERAERIAAATVTGTAAASGSASGTPSQPFVAILAHSYGSTAAMLALQEDDISVNALAIVGSPGSPALSASDLHVTNGNVWVGAADTDPVPQTGIFGSQPLAPSYGAHQFGVNGVTDPVTGTSLRAAIGHNDYFVTGTESLRNMVLIGIGRNDLVLGTDGASALPVGKGHGTVPKGPLL